MTGHPQIAGQVTKELEGFEVPAQGRTPFGTFTLEAAGALLLFFSEMLGEIVIPVLGMGKNQKIIKQVQMMRWFTQS